MLKVMYGDYIDIPRHESASCCGTEDRPEADLVKFEEDCRKIGANWPKYYNRVDHKLPKRETSFPRNPVVYDDLWAHCAAQWGYSSERALSQPMFHIFSYREKNNAYLYRAIHNLNNLLGGTGRDGEGQGGASFDTDGARQMNSFVAGHSGITPVKKNVDPPVPGPLPFYAAKRQMSSLRPVLSVPVRKNQ
eukprot:gene1911-1981_t